MRKIAFLLAALAAVLTPALAQQDAGANIMDKVVNVPSPKAWVVLGLPVAPQQVDDDKVQGGTAIRIPIPGKGANPWDISARSAITKPVKQGDTLLLAFWARAQAPAEGRQTAILPAIRIEETSAPYTPMAQDQAEITSTWTMYYASGVATKDYQPGSLNAVIHLAVAKQTVDLGPAFVVDLGPNYDQTKLPRNKLAPLPAAGSATPPPSFKDAESRFAGELARLRAMLPVRGTLMNDPSVATLSAYGADQTNQTVVAPEVPGGKALRVAVSKAAGDSFATGTSTSVHGDIRRGDVLFFAFYARATETDTEAQSGVISAINVQMNASPWSVAAGTSVQTPLNTWRVFYASGPSPVDIPSGSAVLTAQIGGHKQTLEFGPAFVLNLGPGVRLANLPVNKTTYPGREKNAPWRAAAEARIRQIRMGDLRVSVTDAAGKPVPGASVRFAMQRHRFHFGSFTGFNLATMPGPDGDKLRASFLSSFNFATSPIYWSDWGWQDPATRANFIADMAWLRDHGVAFRGHTVTWPREDLTPSKIKKLAGDKAAVAKAVLEHVREVVPLTAKYGACCLDVVNEPRTGGYLPSIAGDDIFADIFRTAHQAAPGLRLFVNDYGIIVGGGRDANNITYYHRWLDDMQAKGVPLGGIGFQGHFAGELTDPARVVALFDEFARHKLPIEITEFDVDTPDEEAQADYTRDMLTAVFSHPAVDAFVVWGWWEGDHWKPEAAMIRKDWSEKPNYRVWKDLIYRAWWTDETKAAGPDGTADVRAFYGDYRITVTAAGRSVEREVSFAPDSGTVSVTVK